MPDAFIHDAIRSPRGKGRPDGTPHEVTAVSLSARMLDALTAAAVGDVIWGNVTQAGEQGGCLGRSAVLLSAAWRRGRTGRQSPSIPRLR